MAIVFIDLVVGTVLKFRLQAFALANGMVSLVLNYFLKLVQHFKTEIKTRLLPVHSCKDLLSANDHFKLTYNF